MSGDRREKEAADELRRVLAHLRDEIRSRFPVAAVAEPTESAVDLEGLWNSARRRLGTIGMSEHSAEVDEFGMDDEALRRVEPLLDFLAERFWRVDLRGLANLPAEGPCLLVANRAGLLPWDGLMLAHVLKRALPDRERPRFLVADSGMQWPFVHATIAQLGGVRSCVENAERLLAAGRIAIAFPEGAQGATKAWPDRYRLQSFTHDGVVRLALASGVPLIPVGIVGAEEVHPLMAKLKGPARRVGLPFVPVTPTFPLLGLLGLLPLPSKWLMWIGEPVSLDHPGADADPLAVAREEDAVRSKIAELVERALAQRESIWG
ncbi:MAG: acyltransferase family protein [Deltaproteobacteria bacterium]|nr:acyltransferase family protein [Deltaproteobacteria bacterium]MBW2398085.1 acyltransferase family protein [Deltaproteobacteria bacterium]MBW2665070.1 acyltransferase family protein [Deltaproteobacteria bacterium]